MDKVGAQKLWDKYFKERTIELKNELVLIYIELVKNIVLRMTPKYKGYCSYDDMLSCGILGLMDAIEKYDELKNVKFEYYATMRIRGEVIDNIRKQDWAPSSLRRKIKAINNASEEFEHKHYRSATEDELAQKLGLDVEEVQKTLEKSHMFNVIHFEEMTQDDYVWECEDKSEPMEERIEHTEMVKILGSFIESLSEKEKMVITLYYYEEMTLKEIASILGVSESRTSQIHSKAVMRLRSKMDNVYSK